MKASSSGWFAICIFFAVFLNKVEHRFWWKLFFLFFFLGQIYLYGAARALESKKLAETGD